MLVVGIDAALVDTGVAVIRDSKIVLCSTIHVEGDKDSTGPRYALLRRCLETLFEKRIRVVPDAIAIEQPEHTLRKRGGAGTNPGNILKLYGAFAVCYAECARLFPKTKVWGVMPLSWKGSLGKEVSARIMTARYGMRYFKNSHEADAVGVASWACDRLQDEARSR